MDTDCRELMVREVGGDHPQLYGRWWPVAIHGSLNCIADQENRFGVGGTIPGCVRSSNPGNGVGGPCPYRGTLGGQIYRDASRIHLGG